MRPPRSSSPGWDCEKTARYLGSLPIDESSAILWIDSDHWSCPAPMNERSCTAEPGWLVGEKREGLTFCLTISQELTTGVS